MLRLHEYEYHQPPDLEAALGLLAEHEGDVMPIAGGTDLVPNMKHRLFTPGHLVSLSGLPQLRGIEETDEGLRIGACETLNALAQHPIIMDRFPSLAHACSLISGPQLRRVGTIGGNVCLDTRCTYYNQTEFWRQALGYCLKKDGTLCHVVKAGTRCVAAHSADAPGVLMTLDARLSIAGPAGTREIAVDEFFTSDGIWNRRMEPGELLLSITLPWPDKTARFSFQKLRSRNAIDFPLLNLAAAASFAEDGTVLGLQMVASGMGSYPRRIGKMEDAAVGNRLTDSVIDAVAQQAYRQCHPLDNIIVDKDWRRSMVSVLVRRCLGELSRHAS
ncbi:MAG: FAD binding domain-containing protein [Gemmatimonadota bacterium]